MRHINQPVTAKNVYIIDTKKSRIFFPEIRNSGAECSVKSSYVLWLAIDTRESHRASEGRFGYFVRKTFSETPTLCGSVFFDRWIE